MKKSEIHGYLYVLIGATLCGIPGVIAESLFNIGLPPVELVLLRLSLATLALFLFLLFFDRKKIVVSIQGLHYFFTLGFAGVAGVQFTYYYTSSKVHVASITATRGPVVAGSVAHIVLGEVLHPLQILGGIRGDCCRCPSSAWQRKRCTLRSPRNLRKRKLG